MVPVDCNIAKSEKYFSRRGAYISATRRNSEVVFAAKSEQCSANVLTSPTGLPDEKPRRASYEVLEQAKNCRKPGYDLSALKRTH